MFFVAVCGFCPGTVDLFRVLGGTPVAFKRYPSPEYSRCKPYFYVAKSLKAVSKIELKCDCFSPYQIMNDEERAKFVQKLQKDVEDYVSNLKPKKYEDGWPEDKWEEEMEKHPMFMSQPVDGGQDIPPLVEAMKQLKYDPEFNSPKELAVSYKEDGNENFKIKKYRWAVESYTHGLEAKCEDKELNAVLYTNRAAAQYHIGNYQKALKDVTEAKMLNPNHMKAIHRGAMCCFELKEFHNCILWCNEGLKLSADDMVLTDLKTKAILQKKEAESAKIMAAKNAKKEILELESLNKAIRERGICCEGNGLTAKSFESIHPETVGSKVHLTPGGVLVWPVLLLYPEYGTTDFIKAFDEETCFYEQFVEMFNEKPAWDKRGDYIPQNLKVYFSDGDSFVPVDKMKSLKSTMCHKRFKLNSGILSFFVTLENSKFDSVFRKQNC